MNVLVRALAAAYSLVSVWSLAWQNAGNDGPYLLPATVLVLLAVPVGVALFLKKPAGYVAMCVHAAVTLSVLVIVSRFVKAPTLYFAAAQLLFTAVPFLHGRLRWVFFGGHKERGAERNEIKLQAFVEVDGKRRYGDTVDVSQAGAFLAVSREGLKVTQRVVVQMHLRANKFLRLPAHVVSITEQGIGVEWSHLTNNDHESLKTFVSEGLRMSKMAAPLKLKGSFAAGGQTHACDLYALTTEGCYLDDHQQVLQAGEKVALTIYLHDGDPLEVLAEVVWLPGDATIAVVTKVVGSALEFHGLEKRDAQRIQARLDEEG